MFSLLRRVALFGIVFAVCGGIASAQNLNYHNGIIMLVNDSAYPVDAAVRWNSHTIHGAIRIPPHKAYAFNNCCYAAGSVYELQVSTTANNAQQSFTEYTKPELCNHKGTPLGYSIVRFQARPEPTGRLQGSFLNGPNTRDELRCGQQLLDDLRSVISGE